MCSRNLDVGFELRLSEVISFQSIYYYDLGPSVAGSALLA